MPVELSLSLHSSWAVKAIWSIVSPFASPHSPRRYSNSRFDWADVAASRASLAFDAGKKAALYRRMPEIALGRSEQYGSPVIAPQTTMPKSHRTILPTIAKVSLCLRGPRLKKAIGWLFVRRPVR